MLAQRRDLLAAMRDAGVRVVLLGATEGASDLPEWARDAWPKEWFDWRFRGHGPNDGRPLTLVPEESLLDYAGTPPRGSVVVHELAHAIHRRGLEKLDPSFDRRLEVAYEASRRAHIWSESYASRNRSEYWAVGTETDDGTIRSTAIGRSFSKVVVRDRH